MRAAASAAQSQRGWKPTAQQCWRSTCIRIRTDRASRSRPTSRPPRATVDAALDHLGGLDAVVASAGFQHVAPVAEFPEERWDALLAVLLTSPFLLARYAWDALRESGDGRFLAVASVHGLVASP